MSCFRAFRRRQERAGNLFRVYCKQDKNGVTSREVVRTAMATKTIAQQNRYNKNWKVEWRKEV